MFEHYGWSLFWVRNCSSLVVEDGIDVFSKWWTIATLMKIFLLANNLILWPFVGATIIWISPHPYVILLDITCQYWRGHFHSSRVNFMDVLETL